MKLMQTLAAAALLLAETGHGGSSPSAPLAAVAGLPPLEFCDFDLAYAEDFTDLAIAPDRLHHGARWMAHTPWHGDFGDARFTDPGPGGPFAIEDGALQITATRHAQGPWRSGLLAGGDATGRGWGVRYGYFEARMKLPPGPGTWPAFWLSSLKPFADRRPSVEIDAIEYYGHMPAMYQAGMLVWSKGVKQPTLKALHMVPVAAGSLVGQFHDYGLRVDPQHVTWYFDRKPVWQQATPSELTTPLFPLVNLALGSGYSTAQTPDPSVLVVSHVRIWRDRAAAENMTGEDARALGLQGKARDNQAGCKHGA